MDAPDQDRTAAVQALCRDGVCQLAVAPELAELNRRVFALVRRVLQRPADQLQRHAIDLGAGTGLNGWHGPGGLSKNNKYRSGIIFEGDRLWDLLDSEPAAFVATVGQWRDAVWGLATQLLRLVAAELQLEDTFFEEAMEVCSNSQFHVKRYHPAAPGDGSGAAHATPAGEVVKLFAHMDPSVLSVVIHDGGPVQEGGRGLQVRARESGEFLPLPRSGWGVATVFVGQILQRITGGLIPAAVHRVAVRPQDDALERLTATFFFQPTPAARLGPVPSPLVQASGGPGQAAVTYAEWKEKAYGRYYAHK